jgi:hypothetical protein
MGIVLFLEDGPFRYESYKESENKHCWIGGPHECKDRGTAACKTCKEDPDRYRVVVGYDSYRSYRRIAEKVVVSTFDDEYDAEDLCEKLNQAVLEWVKTDVFQKE